MFHVHGEKMCIENLNKFCNLWKWDLLISNFLAQRWPNSMFSDDESLPPSVVATGSEAPSLPDNVCDTESEMDMMSDTKSLPDSVISSDSELFLPDDVNENLEVEGGARIPERRQQTVPSPDTVFKWLQNLKSNPKNAAEIPPTLGMELYSPPRVLATARGMDSNLSLGPLSFDIMNGWDLSNGKLQQLTFSLLETGTVTSLVLSPPCTMFSELQRLWNMKKIPPDVWAVRLGEATEHIEFSMRAARKQIERKKRFAYEHPWKASSSKLPCVESVRDSPSVMTIDFDMCACGMKSPMNEPIRKRTRIMTNSTSLVAQLRRRQCPRNHTHRQIKGSQLGHSLSRWCQVYPEDLANILASCLDDDEP